MKFLLPLLLLLGCADREPLLRLDSEDPEVREAADTWNQALGFDAVVFTPHGVKVKIIPDLETEGAYFLPGLIAFRPGAPLGLYVHELGHAMGASHEDNKRSVMHPVVTLWEITDSTLDEILKKNGL